MAVPRGDFFAITGANGSGKGTFCRCLARINKESQGRILLDGRPLLHQTQDLPALGVMVVLQGTRVFPEMSVLDNLLCAPATWRNGDRQKKLDSVLGLFPHLKGRLRQAAGTLSGGEQQMVAIGRALMVDPSLLVLEEPSLGLAAQTATDVYAALARISREGKTVIVTEETLVVPSAFVSTACCMTQGRITGIGRPPAASDHATPRQTVISQ